MTTEHDSKPQSAPPPSSGAASSDPQASSGDAGARRQLAAQGILTSGSRFGSYVVGPCIGQGGMARVYRAEHEGLQRQVALKVLTQGLVGSDEHDRFVREARLAAAIKHPNVVNIFDVGVENGVPYLVMEFLEGEDLDTQLQAQHRISEDTIIDIMVPVVAGLTAVHDAGVIHRDLKPGNIFLARGRHDELEPKLLDFGISKSMGPDRGKITATRGLLMGTPFYMAPETIRGAAITELSDQYALGVVMYECASGNNPFAADSFAEVVDRVTTANYPSISSCETAISPKLAKIIERAMSLEPESRYPTLRDLGRDLLRLAGQRTRVTWGLTFGDVAQSPARPEPTRPLLISGTDSQPTVKPSSGRKRMVAAVLGAAALCAAVVFGMDPLETTASLDAGSPESVVMEAKAVQAPTTPRPEAEFALARSERQDSRQPPTKEAESESGESGSEEAETARATEESETTSAQPAKVTRKRTPQRTRRVVRRKSRSRKRGKSAPKPKADNAERPAWALAPAELESDQPAKAGPVLGTNNAPILD